MKIPPPIINASSLLDRTIRVTFQNGIVGEFNFENYFDYLGHYQFLKDISSFKKIQIHPDGNYLFWLNDQSEEVEIDPAILYAICTHEKIIIDNKIVFDPSLGKNAWL